jgi:hypothetical protein
LSIHLRPDVQTLPSHAQLFKATGVALVVAAIILTTVVLPAEYGIDPTRIGGKLGLTALSGSHSTSAEVSSPAPVTAPPEAAVVQRTTPFRSDTMSLTLQPGKGAEIKAAMQAGDRFVFSWTADGGLVNFDLHGEAPNAGNDFTSYLKDQQQGSGHGAFVAPFLGTHGWYWANRGQQPVTVTVKTSGFYDKLYKP